MRRLAAGLACLLVLAGCGAASHHPSGHVSARHALPAAQSALGSVVPAGWGQTPPNLPRALSPRTGVPTATMYDAVTVGNIPASAAAVAGYLNGHFLTWPSLLSGWPHARHVGVMVFAFPVYPSTVPMACLDVEPLDAVPSQAGPWAKGEIAVGVKPCFYSDLSEMPAVRSSLAQWLGSGWRAKVLLWLAWYRFVPGLVGDYDAVQYSDRCLNRSLDCSTASRAFLGIAQPPVPKPRPAGVVCFHRRESKAACSAARAKVASDQRAVAASRRALAPVNADLRAHGCTRPYRRGVCVRAGRRARVFLGRVSYFRAAGARVKAAN